MRSSPRKATDGPYNAIPEIIHAGRGHICLYSAWSSRTRVVGGVPFEMARSTADAGYGVCNNSSADFEIEGMKRVLEQMAEGCGCGLLYHSFFCESIVEI